MKITTSKANGTVHFGIECQCGWITVGHWTLESAGRAADKHIAETQRWPCANWKTGQHQAAGNSKEVAA